MREQNQWIRDAIDEVRDLEAIYGYHGVSHKDRTAIYQKHYDLAHRPSWGEDTMTALRSLGAVPLNTRELLLIAGTAIVSIVGAILAIIIAS